AAFILSLPARAQTGTEQVPVLVGVVREAPSGQAMPSVSVELLDAGGQTVSVTVSDARGRFRLNPSAAGTYRARARRIGYRPAESALTQIDGTVTADLTLERGVTLD